MGARRSHASLSASRAAAHVSWLCSMRHVLPTASVDEKPVARHQARFTARMRQGAAASVATHACGERRGSVLSSTSSVPAPRRMPPGASK